jgi:dTDP-4-amino-4,6-dideoxygalactose transaminase
VSDAPIPLFDVRLSEADIAAVEETLRSGWLTMGPRIAEFEAQFAEHLGVRHAVALSSCTAALHLAYLAAGVGPGDEVIVPATTFVATAAAVRYCGGQPVLADVAGPHDLSIDPSDAERRITARTKAICVVHYGGYAGPLDELGRICREHGIALIEDAAHSPSATVPGQQRRLGTYGLAGCFSFFSNKVLSCGEGGLLATDDDRVASATRSLRSHAMTTGTWDRHKGHSLSYDVVDLGFNHRMDEPRAALLLSRLRGLEEDIAARRRLVHRYRELLRDVDGLTIPYESSDVDASSCYVMPLVLHDPELQAPLRELLRDRWQVQTSMLYPSISEFTAYPGAVDPPVERSERIARTQVTIPLYPHLSEADQDRVIRGVREALAELRASKRDPARAPSD